MDKCKYNQKKLWQFVNKKIKNKQTNKQNEIQSIKNNETGYSINKVEDIAEYFNSYFCKFGKDLAKKIRRNRNRNNHSRVNNKVIN